MQRPSSPYSSCFFFSVNAFARALTKAAEPYFAEIGLTPTRAFLLMSIVREPGITVGKLAREVDLDPSTVSRALDRMERDSLIYRDISGSNMRAFPTPAANTLEKDAQAAWGKVKVLYESKFTKDATDLWAEDLDRSLRWLRN